MYEIVFFYLQEHFKKITFDNISPSFNIRYTCIWKCFLWPFIITSKRNCTYTLL